MKTAVMTDVIKNMIIKMKTDKKLMFINNYI